MVEDTGALEQTHRGAHWGGDLVLIVTIDGRSGRVGNGVAGQGDLFQD